MAALKDIVALTESSLWIPGLKVCKLLNQRLRAVRFMLYPLLICTVSMGRKGAKRLSELQGSENFAGAECLCLGALWSRSWMPTAGTFLCDRVFFLLEGGITFRYQEIHNRRWVLLNAIPCLNALILFFFFLLGHWGEIVFLVHGLSERSLTSAFDVSDGD